MRIIFVVCSFLFATLTPDATIECFTCSNVTTIAECKPTVTCNTGEICYTDYIPSENGTLYSFGCRSEAICKTIVHSTRNGTSGGAGSLVGRSVSLSPCSQCCKEHHCNRQLCQQSFSEKECSDSKTIDCFSLEQLANICADTKRANSVCRRTCGLCSYFDGYWAGWSTWSTCDVTCGDGHQTRSRTCTEPAPSGGGLDCKGRFDDSQICTLQPCPVHGHWAQWSPWGRCSATCGIGMQRRDRTCSNPYPGKFGDHCFSDSRDDQLCVVAMCPVINGGWNSWSTWTSCTSTCDGGMKSHYRNCNNPMPSAGGNLCTGSPYEETGCNQQACPIINGGWNSWSTWTSCTSTCGGGMISHYRNCNNPMPSAGGNLCTGSPYEVTGCNQQACPRKLSAFTAKGPSEGHCLHILWFFTYCNIIFSQIVLNEGFHYSNGSFTCSYPGLYYFEAYLIARDNSENYFYCKILKNGSSVVELIQNNSNGARNGTFSSTGATTLHLVVGNIVNVQCVYHSQKPNLYASSSFSGFLVSPDP